MTILVVNSKETKSHLTGAIFPPTLPLVSSQLIHSAAFLALCDSTGDWSGAWLSPEDVAPLSSAQLLKQGSNEVGTPPLWP